MINVALAGQYPKANDKNSDGTLERFRKALPADQFAITLYETEEEFNSIKDAEVLILRNFEIKEAQDFLTFVGRNPNLKLICRWGVGVDCINLEEAGKRGIAACNTPGANAESVAQLVLMEMLAIGRRLVCHIEQLADGNWSRNDYINNSWTLQNKVVGIIGCGNIGRNIAHKVQMCGASVIYYDVFRMSKEREKELNLTYMELDDVIRNADVLTLHVPLTKENEHLINKERLAMMKKGAILINASRGGVVDDNALYHAVENGHLLGAGLDVVEREPLPDRDPMLHNPNILVTPHIGGNVTDIGDNIIPMIVQSIQDYAAGTPAKDIHYCANKPYLKDAK